MIHRLIEFSLKNRFLILLAYACWLFGVTGHCSGRRLMPFPISVKTR